MRTVELCSPSTTGSCRLSRRQLLSIGTLGIGGFTLSSLLAARGARAATPDLTTGKSVIFVFQQGGPSQLETFDPKPEAPSEFRTLTGCAQTSAPGVLFGDTMRQLSRHADKLIIVRSFQTENAIHNIQPLVSANSLNANLGSLISRVVGSTRPDTGIPTNAVLFPQAVCTDVTKGSARGDVSATGSLGSGYAFIPGADQRQFAKGYASQSATGSARKSARPAESIRPGYKNSSKRLNNFARSINTKNRRIACCLAVVWSARDLSQRRSAYAGSLRYRVDSPNATTGANLGYVKQERLLHAGAPAQPSRSASCCCKPKASMQSSVAASSPCMPITKGCGTCTPTATI